MSSRPSAASDASSGLTQQRGNRRPVRFRADGFQIPRQVLNDLPLFVKHALIGDCSPSQFLPNLTTVVLQIVRLDPIGRPPETPLMVLRLSVVVDRIQ